MCKWNHKVSFTHSRHEWCNLTNFHLAFFLLMSLLENATLPWGQSWERVLHKHSCLRHLCRTHSRDCSHGEIRHLKVLSNDIKPKHIWKCIWNFRLSKNGTFFPLTFPSFLSLGSTIFIILDQKLLCLYSWSIQILNRIFFFSKELLNIFTIAHI